MTALRAVPDQAMDGAGLQERQLSQIEDDGFTRNQDLVARILKVLDGCQIELPSKENHTRRLNQDEEASGAVGGHRALWSRGRPVWHAPMVQTTLELLMCA
jgi:hypothetical protein